MPSKYTVLSVTTLGALMTALDSTIVYLAIPAMASYFNTGLGYLTLVIVVYLIATTSTMVPSGGMATRFGKKKLYLAGFATFTLSSLVIAFSPNVLTAIIFRAVEGVGGGIMGTVGIPILLSAFPSSEHGKAIGINSIAWSVGALVGPVLGGVLVSFDWRYIFLINIPIGIIAIMLGIGHIPADSGEKSTKVNIGNIVGFLLFIVPLTAGISFLNSFWLATAALLSPVFALSQIKAPLVPASLLRNRNYSLLLAATSLQALSFFAVSYAMSIYLQSDARLSPLTAGMVLAANPSASLITSPLGGYLYDRTRKGTIIMLSGLLLQGSCVLTLSYAILNTSVLSIFIILFLSGVGGTLFWTASTVLAVNEGGERNRSLASGTLFMLRNMALVIGLSSFPIFVAGSSAGISALFTLQGNLSLLHPVREYLITIAALSYTSSLLILLYRLLGKSAEA
ncbi:MAG: MFS transporter [Conexivisphaerales archaeon]